MLGSRKRLEFARGGRQGALVARARHRNQTPNSPSVINVEKLTDTCIRSNSHHSTMFIQELNFIKCLFISNPFEYIYTKEQQPPWANG